MSRDLEARVAAVAARQHGVVTCRQLADAGVSSGSIERRLRSGRLQALHRGIYLAAPFPLPRTCAMAAVLASGPGAVLSHLHAAVLWGLYEPAGSLNGPVDVSGTGSHLHRPGIRFHRVRLGRGDCTVTEGIPVTTPARTVLDVATVLGRRELEQVVARADREGLLSAEALGKLLAARRGRRGVRTLRAVAEAPGGAALTRSAAEARFLGLVREARLPAPECNVALGRYEVDFLWRAEGLAVEIDGFRFHRSRSRFEGDRRRDAELLASGITVLRLSWRQISAEAVATAVQLCQALDHARSRRTPFPAR